jgi:hypothetical protein
VVIPFILPCFIFQEKMERPVRAPAVNFKVAIERQDIAGLQFPGLRTGGGVIRA